MTIHVMFISPFLLQENTNRLTEVVRLLDLGYSLAEVSRRLDINRSTIYRTFRRNGLERARFTDIVEADLETMVNSIKSNHPNIGESILMGHLRARSLTVSRSRLRALLHRTDRAGIAQRRSSAIVRREYLVPCPNYIWHLDGMHKMIRWKFVVHGAVDGFSRLIPFMHCSTDNRASTVHALFNTATQHYGRPLRVRTDHGGENVQVWDHMLNSSGIEASVIVGSSVHNQRIERMWRDVNRLVSNTFKEQFHELEAAGDLDPLNATDLYCLHLVYLPLINCILDEHVAAHNHHSLTTESSYTPHQLFSENQHLLELHQHVWNQSGRVNPEDGNSRTVGNLQRDELPHVQLSVTRMNIPNHIHQQATNIVSSSTLAIRNAMSRYQRLSEHIGQYFSDISL